MKNNNTLVIVAIFLALVAIGLAVSVSFTGNTIFDINKKISVSLGKTSNFVLEDQSYSLTVNKISGNQVSFILRNRDTRKSVNYTVQQSEGLPVWQRYDLYISNIAGKIVTFTITEKSISAGNAYTKEETDKRITDAITNVLDNIIEDEVVEPLMELQRKQSCIQFLALESNDSVNIGGQDYFIELLNLTSPNEAVIRIGIVTQTVEKGQTYNLGKVSGGSLTGLETSDLKVYVKGIQYPSTPDDASILMLEISNCVL